jgi:hypothetical protein
MFTPCIEVMMLFPGIQFVVCAQSDVGRSAMAAKKGAHRGFPGLDFFCL